MATSSIEWTELTWNPTTGCDKISAGCKFCYAEIMSRRLRAMGVEKYADGFKVREHESALSIPFGWKKPAMVFVNSMSDLFHKDVSLEFIQRVFAVMNANEHLIFQVLTKRSDRLAEICGELTWTQNIWMGVSVEDDRVTHRIDDLLAFRRRCASSPPSPSSARSRNSSSVESIGSSSEVRAVPSLARWTRSGPSRSAINAPSSMSRSSSSNGADGTRKRLAGS